ncbi:glycosyl transferase [Candidatus Micrarchaeota archaeon CG10_big_fil_rev_8_21_14_0_10_45_29]|nr:MAG: glycosyl transferase [Candidatus Micrarchaeota archaeon CG10_big_fil_rev_8_21_14_0_10_45_29]
MKIKKVSVIIPTLNEQKLIESTLKSIRAQQFDGKIELIVADGGSEDNTVKIAKKYCDKVVRETTNTIAAGRQAGSEAATGEVFLYTDADTDVDKYWVKNLSAAFEDKKVSAAYGWIVPYDAKPMERIFLEYGALLAGKFLNLVRIDYVAGSNMALRNKAFWKIGGFNVNLVTGEDTDVIKRARKAGKVVFVPKAEIKYSLRRIRDWGYPKYIFFHTKNFFSSHFLKKSAGGYEAVRTKV